MFFHRRTIPGLAIHSYIVGDEKSHQCVVIDPVRDVEEYVEIAEKNGLTITHILETHVHADFVSGALELKTLLNGIPQIHSSGMGGKEWTPDYVDVVAKEGDEVVLGGLRLKCIHTPGHTPEHVMWALYSGGEIKKLFTGDFLFVGAIGRPDLLGDKEVQKLSHQLYHSVFKKLSLYPDDVEVRPAHGAGSLCGKALSSDPYSTLGHERVHNPSLQPSSEEVWINNLMSDMPPAPHYFSRMKKVNVSGLPMISRKKIGMEPLSPEKVKQSGATIIDFRSKEAFAAAHISGSVSIPFSPKIATWAGWFLPDNDLILVVDEKEHLQEVVTQLLRVGYDKILGHLEGGIWNWESQGYPLETLETITSAELQNQLDDYYVLDIRTNPEWRSGRIRTAIHFEAGEILKHINDLPKNKNIAVVCGSGFRASIVSSLLKKNGLTKVTNVFGGMSAWPGEIVV